MLRENIKEDIRCKNGKEQKKGKAEENIIGAEKQEQMNTQRDQEC